MRHLLDTYVQVDRAVVLGELDRIPLTELIVEIGIHDAIARKLNAKGDLSKRAIAETIINNVRKTIVSEQLTDPRFYEQMSKLQDDLIQQSREDTAAYEAFLRKAEDLARRLAAKPKDLLEYVVVHEMLHLLERAHGTRFIELLDRHRPGWREARAELNALPLAAGHWLA